MTRRGLEKGPVAVYRPFQDKTLGVPHGQEVEEEGLQEARRVRRPHGDDRLRLDRAGRAAADLPSHRHQARADHHHLGRGPRRAEGDQALRRHLHQEAPDPREPAPDPGEAARQGRLPGQSVGRGRLDGAGRALPGEGRALHRHLHRAVARRLHRSRPLGLAALELCAARDHAEARAQVPRRADGSDRPRRQPGPGLAFRQEGAGQSRQGHRPGRRAADQPRGLGRAGARPRRQGDPHRRARHPGLEEAQEGRRVRQHLVDRRLRLRGQPAGRDGLGHAREGPAVRRRAPRVRLRRRDLPQPAGAAHPRAHLDAARGAVPRLHHHPQRIRSRSPTISRCATAATSSTGRPCTTPITRATRRSCPCTRSPGRTCTSRRSSA